MKKKIQHLLCILAIASSCTHFKGQITTPINEGFTFKKGVLVTHWTGVVAPRYMGQSNIPHTYGADWFDEDDVKWLASKGFDHLQINVDVRWWFSDSIEKNTNNIETYKKAVDWANANDLGVILIFDTHPFAEQPDSYDKREITERAVQWEEISKQFLSYKEGLRFHFGNREIPLNSNPSNRFTEYFNAIRSVDKERFIYIPIPIDIDTTMRYKPYLNYPEGGTYQNLTALNLNEMDERVGISFTYFEPEVFIYQKPDQEPKVPFPGTVPEFDNTLPDSIYYPQYLPIGKSMSGKHIGDKSIMEDFSDITRKLENTYPNRTIYLERFGVHFGLDSLSSVNYIRAVKNSAETNNIAWCIYDYESGRAIRDSVGNPFPHFYGLDLKEKE